MSRMSWTLNWSCICLLFALSIFVENVHWLQCLNLVLSVFVDHSLLFEVITALYILLAFRHIRIIQIEAHSDENRENVLTQRCEWEIPCSWCTWRKYDLHFVVVKSMPLRLYWFIKFHPPTFPSWHYWLVLYGDCLEQRLSESFPRKQSANRKLFGCFRQKRIIVVVICRISGTDRYWSIVFCMYVATFTFCSSFPPTGFSLCVLQGNVCSDCLYGCCCYPLSWLQISRELKRRAASHASSSSSSARYTVLDSLQGAHLV